MWYTWKYHQTGAQHLAVCQPYEDRCMMVQTWDDRLILAVADGHGDSRCIRAKDGARFACEAAVNILSHSNTFDRRSLELVKAYFDHLVRFDLTKHPLQQEECNVLSYMPSEYTYGTTLLCAVICKEGTFRCQLGDGTMALLDKTGRLLPPLEDDRNCYGNATSSMIDPNAADLFRWDFSPEPAVAALLHTDGYDDGSPQSWELLKLLLDPPEKLPEKVLHDGNHGDDQTVLMALNKDYADSEVFRTGLDLERQVMQARNAISDLEIMADVCRRTIQGLEACFILAQRERLEKLLSRMENRRTHLIYLEECIRHHTELLVKAQNTQEDFLRSLVKKASDNPEPHAEQADPGLDTCDVLTEENQDSDPLPEDEKKKEGEEEA